MLHFPNQPNVTTLIERNEKHMMEHNTDRLFWTLTSIIVGALMLTLSVKIFPQYTQSAIQPLQGIVRQADNSTSAFVTGNGSNADNDNVNNGYTVGSTNGPSVVTNNDSQQLANQQQVLSQQNVNLNNKVNNQQQQINSLNNTINNLQNQNNIFNGTISSLQNKIDAANAANDRLNTQLNNALQSAKNVDPSIISTLQSQTNDLYNQITSLNQGIQQQAAQNSSTISNLNNIIVNFKSQIDQLSNDKDNNASQIDGFNLQIQSLQATIQDLQNENQALSNKLDSANQTAQQQYQTYQAQVAGNTSQIQTLQNTISQNNDLINTLQNQVNNNNQIVNQLNNNVMTYRGLLVSPNDLNNVTQSGYYAVNGTPPTNAPTGNWIATVEVINNGNGNVIQRWIDYDYSGSSFKAHEYLRTLERGSWNSWMTNQNSADIQDANASAQVMRFMGDMQSNVLANATTPGIYNLAGKLYTDMSPQNGGTMLWGQLVVMNTGGVCTQTVYTNGGAVYTRTINSWGTTAWRPIGQ